MNEQVHYRINEPNVAHEVIEGEVVIVDLLNGSYYSTENSGADVWSGLVSGANQSQIITVLQTHYVAGNEGIADGVDLMFQLLLQEKLIVADPAGKGTIGTEWLVSEAEGTFVTPEIQKYTDMEELLVLDPIHEVAEAGWPHPQN